MEICQFQKSDKDYILLSYRSFVTASFRWYPLWLWGQWHRPFFTRRPCRLSATGSDESVLLRLSASQLLACGPFKQKQLRQIQLDDIICDHKFLPMLDQNKGIGQEPKFGTWPPRLEITEFLGLGLLVLKHTWSPRSTASMMRKIWETSSGKKNNWEVTPLIVSGSWKKNDDVVGFPYILYIPCILLSNVPARSAKLILMPSTLLSKLGWITNAS